MPRAPTDPHDSALDIGHAHLPWILDMPVSFGYGSHLGPIWDPFLFGAHLGPIWGPIFRDPFMGIGRGPGTHF